MNVFLVANPIKFVAESRFTELTFFLVVVVVVVAVVVSFPLELLRQTQYAVVSEQQHLHRSLLMMTIGSTHQSAP